MLTPKTNRRLNLEALEDRAVPAGGFVLSPNGTLTVTGSNAADSLRVYNSGNRVFFELRNNGQLYSINYSKYQVSQIVFNAGGSDDIFRNETEIRSLFNASSGRDIFYGGMGDDVAYGGSGDDSLYGGKGHDRLYGEGDRDYLNGQEGNDYLDGGYDGNIADTMVGGAGMDVFAIHSYTNFWRSTTYHRENVVDYRMSEGDSWNYVRHSWW